MAPTTFPRFTELPLELQTIVWKYAIGDACARYHPDLTTMNIIADFSRNPWPLGNIPQRHWVSVSVDSLLERRNFQRWVAPRTGTEIYWLHSWYRNSLNNLLNSCCMGRLVTLKWMRAGAESGPQLVPTESVDVFKRLVSEIIEVLERRV